MPRTLLVISAWSNPKLEASVATDRSPRKDYVELARAVHGTILYRDTVRAGVAWRALAKVLGVPVTQAIIAFRHRYAYDAVFTDAENVGLPLALLFKLTRTRRRHVMIGHLLTTPWKRFCCRVLRAQSHVDAIICHSSRQRWLLEHRLGIAPERIALLPYQVDERFWRPLGRAMRRQICSVGLEFRDYRTLITAARELDLEVVIAAASHWSRRRDEARGPDLPPNVRVTTLDYERLRELYAESMFTVVPLHDVEFQAGITVILETMAMAKAVVVSRTRGQTDVVRDQDGLPNLLGAPAPGFRDLRGDGADATGQDGVYVPPGDATALRDAIKRLADRPDVAATLGENGRRAVECRFTLDQYVRRIAALLDGE